MKDQWNRDIESFYNSQEGKEFYAIKPLIISYAKNRDYEKIYTDVMSIWLFYDCKLNVYVMPDRLYFKLFKWSYYRHYRVPEFELAQSGLIKARKDSPTYDDVRSILELFLLQVRFRPPKIYEFQIDYYGCGKV